MTAMLDALPETPDSLDGLTDALESLTVAPAFELTLTRESTWMCSPTCFESCACNIQDQAMRVGYHSEAAFNRAFKRATGSPPATWRKGTLSA
jgi:AraC-like DNA-binding protein